MEEKYSDPASASSTTGTASPRGGLFLPRWARFALYGFLLAAGLLRLADLGSKSLWVDEACGLIWDQASIEHINERYAETHAAPLRDYYLHTVWALPRNCIEAASRLPSALAGALLVPLMFFLGRRLFGLEAGLFAALFTLAHPWLLLHSQDNRMHILTVLFSVVILGLLWRLLREKHSLALWAALGAALALFGWFSFLAGMVYVAVACVITTEAVVRLMRKEPGVEIRRLLAGSAIAAAVFLLLYAPMFPIAFRTGRLYLMAKSGGAGPSRSLSPIALAAAALHLPTAPAAPNSGEKPTESSRLRPDSKQLVPRPGSEASFATRSPYETQMDLAYVKHLLSEFGGQQPLATTFAMGFALVGIAVLATKHRREVWISVFWFAAPLPFLLLTKVGRFFPPRYVLYAMAAYAPLVGLGAAAVFHLLRQAFLRAGVGHHRLAAVLAGALVVGPILVPHLLGVVRYYRAEKQDWRGAMQYLESHALNGDRILVGDHWAIYGVEMYRNRQMEKQLDILPDVLSLESFAEAVLSTDSLWYIYWAKLPPCIQQITDAAMEEIKVFPGLLGDVHILRKKAYPSPPFAFQPVRYDP